MFEMTLMFVIGVYDVGTTDICFIEWFESSACDPDCAFECC